MLDEHLLEEATKISQSKTYSGAVQMALRQFIHRAKARKILELTGLGLWEGDLAQMREDKSKRAARRAAR